MFNTRWRARQRFVRLRSNDKVRCSKFESPATTFYVTKTRTWLNPSSAVSRRRSDVHDIHTRKKRAPRRARHERREKNTRTALKIADRSTIRTTSLILNSRRANAHANERESISRQSESTTGL